MLLTIVLNSRIAIALTIPAQQAKMLPRISIQLDGFLNADRTFAAIVRDVKLETLFGVGAQGDGASPERGGTAGTGNVLQVATAEVMLD